LKTGVPKKKVKSMDMKEIAFRRNLRHLFAVTGIETRSPKERLDWICTSPRDLHRNTLIFLGRGLDESWKSSILTNGSGVDRAICRGVTVGSKKVFPE
jgi:hypothetical protein